MLQPKEIKIECQIGKEIKIPYNLWLNQQWCWISIHLNYAVASAKRSMTENQSGKEVFASARKLRPSKRTDGAFAEAKLHPAKKVRRRQSTISTKFNHSGTGSKLTGEFDPDFVFVDTKNWAAAPRTKREPAIFIPSNEIRSQFTAFMAEPAKETTEPLETAVQMAG